LDEQERFEEIRAAFPQADITMISTAGEIYQEEVHEDSISLVAIELEKSRMVSRVGKLEEGMDQTGFGKQLAEELDAEDLKLVFVLSDGHSVNVDDLVLGLNEVVGNRVPVTGGLAGDGVSFQRTTVGLNAPPEPGQVIVIGLYGDDLKIGHGSKGGWIQFGPERTVTRSEGNLLYELDGQSALGLYKEYLGDKAKDLPGSALLFPLAIDLPEFEEPLVRTVLNVDEDTQCMLYAGNIPQGASCRLMHANFDRIVDGAADAARDSLMALDSFEPELSILISCVGRKLLLGIRAEDEVEEVRSVVGENSILTGFYSYGELSPLGNTKGCQLHNQTMTITTLSEA